ncbi:toprim domain-containing protein [Larsenimonas suaedae]|uniref:Toprim domain-containing protein n=1 Tax=Larsenimonas suaedae TaxID=1851019 RepID=A0ABU1GY74_9GAMM|nr:toprim domain-containing protein [Larsenimonas suaedae]MCM2972897.1 toprim domain-containing protein [Larsenimonas suaedae]MDR5896996.1 toprim domain-containing protein [Larsenimonas suaedae]
MNEQKKLPDSKESRAKIEVCSEPNYTSEYLIKKGISFDDLNAHTSTCIQMKGQVLYREIIDASGRPKGFERIWPDGTKKVTYGATVKGSFTPFGFSWQDWPTLRGELIVCAGLADGYRIHTATNIPVACGVGENNLKSIADSLFTCFSHAQIIVAADNDEAGIRAAKRTGRKWIIPKEMPDAT